ncbi:methyltransferase domain-containing protein [Rhodobacteraceae bacterium 2CG4]|uniref:Protein-L-isoaspartate O-methyltransferase n=1 Tax=Halovulum marinum TaxID=2662447 RepID=A0A6L5Z0Z7_9RHOB|nr:methyltransferase domain-containing protein [Halovulum marinum]MSU89755.1 methyltransferase domain-containing protein [Halovulum marinum]
MTDYAAARTIMVDSQVRPSDVTRYPIIEAMLAVPREEFVPAALKPVAYAGAHVPLSGNRVVLDPRVFSKIIDALEVGPRDLVLDVGCGLGYSTAVISRLAEAVIAVEEIPEMAAEAAETLAAQGADNAVVTEGPLAGGDPSHGPYDVIVLEGGVEQLPEALPAQLKDGGRIAMIHIEGTAGRARIGFKTGGRIAWRYIFDATAPVLEGFEATPGFKF